MGRRNETPRQTSRRQVVKGMAAAGFCGTFSGAQFAGLGRMACRQAGQNCRPVCSGRPYRDAAARIVAQGLNEVMAGATVIVENKAGAGGNIGMGQVLRAPSPTAIRWSSRRARSC